MSTFDYLIDKIDQSSPEQFPFTHIEILDFFSEEHFARITQAPEIAIPAQQTDEGVFDALFERGYKIIDFPGCIVDKNAYLRWHREKKVDHRSNSACEGFGVTLRMMSPRTPIIVELFEFLKSARFQQALADKFGVGMDSVFYDCGIQKYLDGYEISPHPDIRRKALTYMVNINPDRESESREHHTHYMRFRAPYKYVQSYWDGRADEDRCWIPWDWCETLKQQRANNSLVIFAPSNATLHAVRARYDHLAHQRTQLYGNLWYHEVPVRPGPQWEDFCIRRSDASAIPSPTLTDRVKDLVPANLKKALKRALGRDDSSVIADRLANK